MKNILLINVAESDVKYVRSTSEYQKLSEEFKKEFKNKLKK